VFLVFPQLGDSELVLVVSMEGSTLSLAVESDMFESFQGTDPIIVEKRIFSNRY